LQRKEHLFAFLFKGDSPFSSTKFQNRGETQQHISNGGGLNSVFDSLIPEKSIHLSNLSGRSLQ